MKLTLNFLLLLSQLVCFGQEIKEPIEIIITGHHVITKEYVRKNDSIFKASLRPDWVPTNAPSATAQDSYSQIQLINRKNYFLDYRTQEEVRDGFKYTIISSMKQVQKDSLKKREFRPVTFQLTSYKSFSNKDNFPYRIIETDENRTKTVDGFNCFYVKMESIKFPGRFIDMYVTNQIKLAYHPLISSSKIISQFYPLYMKIYNGEFPNDDYKEYTFRCRFPRERE
ncbi:hypothetical protein [Gilvibacter sp.]|uniref:hypothetical protein n=1 Tax=Gilvibacter sp. TaxID=2729997 RepID=UPI003F4A4DD4